MLRENMLGWVKEAEQKGLEKGLERGLEKGLERGRDEGRELFLRQLERRFGGLSTAVRQRVEAADSERLLEWGERFVDAQSLGQVFGEPGSE